MKARYMVTNAYFSILEKTEIKSHRTQPHPVYGQLYWLCFLCSFFLCRFFFSFVLAGPLRGEQEIGMPRFDSVVGDRVEKPAVAWRQRRLIN